MPKKLLKLSLEELFKTWSKNMSLIINDLTQLVYKRNDYKKYFNDIDNINYWWIGLTNISKEVYTILTKNERGIYVGLLLIFISLMLFAIQITS